MSLVFRIAFLIRPRVISVDVYRIAAFVSVDPCVSRSRVGPSYSLFRVLRYLCVRSELGMHRDNRDAVLRTCCAVSFPWLSRCDMFSFVHRSLRSVRRENRAHVSLAFRSEPFVVASYLMPRESVVSVALSLYVFRHLFAVIRGVRKSSS